MTHPPSVLLVNPVIHDFAAYDFWARPLGLLWVGALLRHGGARVSLLDCMDSSSSLILDNLEAAGYERADIGVYVMVGLPGQGRQEVEQTLDVVLASGARPHLAEYSPVPGSPMFAAARAASRWDLSEPLSHNPTRLPCAGDDLDSASLQEIKQALKQPRGALIQHS